MLVEVNNIRTYAANQRREYQGQLTLSTTHTQARFVLPPAVALIKQAYPQVTVHLQQAAESDVLDELGQGGADIAIVSTAGSAPSSGLAVPLYRWRRLVIVPCGHPLDTVGCTLDLAALAEYPLVSYDSSIRPMSSLQRAFASLGLESRIVLTALDADLIKTYVRAGLGVGILRRWRLMRSIPICVLGRYRRPFLNVLLGRCCHVIVSCVTTCWSWCMRLRRRSTSVICGVCSMVIRSLTGRRLLAGNR